MRKSLKVFISSPGDVGPERRCAALVIEKLRQHYAPHFDLEVVRWESEPMLASGHFQDAIEPPSASDVVVLLLWSCIGVPLPARTQRREYRGIDGRIPVTGTEWEYEEALAAARTGGLPDLLAYLKTAPVSIHLDDAARKAQAEVQWADLGAFLRRHFQDGGQFINALNRFETLEAFAKRLEADLRKLLDRRVATLRGDAARPAWTGKPFRGLLAYAPEHARVFFGREAAIRRGVERLAHAAERGCPFLLVLGASGSGKSSLALAGIVPRLATPGVVEGVGHWRRAVMRPGGADGRLLAALARALRAPEALGAELAAGDFGDEAALAAQLGATGAGDPALRPVAAALRRTEAAARAQGTLLAHQSARLALVLDQVEELFTDPAIARSARDDFLALVAALAASGLVWVVATMRSDFWHRAQETPGLPRLAGEERRLDLLPPDPSEVAEMVRGPARLAGLAFEYDAARGVALDAVLAADAAREPGALPLLSFVLDELYRVDVAEPAAAGQPAGALTFSSYERLGGLQGAIGGRAAEVVRRLGGTDPEAAAALPALLRRLVTVRAGGVEPSALPAPLDAFPPGTPRRRLLDTLAAARLLVTEGDEAGARVRPAHEALLRSWPDAAAQIARDRRDLETRDRLITIRGGWTPGRRDGLLAGLQLEEGRDLARRWSTEELPGDLGAYIAASDAAALRRRRLRWWATAGVAALAIGATASAGRLVLALGETQRAQQAAEASAAGERAAADRAELQAARAEDNYRIASNALTTVTRVFASEAHFARPGVEELQREILGALIPFFDLIRGRGQDDGGLDQSEIETSFSVARLVGRVGSFEDQARLFEEHFATLRRRLGDRPPSNLELLNLAKAGALLANNYLRQRRPADARKILDVLAPHFRECETLERFSVDRIDAHAWYILVEERFVAPRPGESAEGRGNRLRDCAIRLAERLVELRGTGTRDRLAEAYHTQLLAYERWRRALPESRQPSAEEEAVVGKMANAARLALELAPNNSIYLIAYAEALSDHAGYVEARPDGLDDALLMVLDAKARLDPALGIAPNAARLVEGGAKVEERLASIHGRRGKHAEAYEAQRRALTFVLRRLSGGPGNASVGEDTGRRFDALQAIANKLDDPRRVLGSALVVAREVGRYRDMTGCQVLHNECPHIAALVVASLARASEASDLLGGGDAATAMERREFVELLVVHRERLRLMARAGALQERLGPDFVADLNLLLPRLE